MTRQIQIGNLPGSVTSDVLRHLFEAYGAVQSATLNTHFETGRSTGVGFVQMMFEDDGAAAIAALNHRERFGQILSACWCNALTNCTLTPSVDVRPDEPIQQRTQAARRDRQWEY